MPLSKIARRRKQPPIGDYGFLSDCHSAALVDRQGSIDWWCLPRFDSPSVLGRLLDPGAGHWLLHPVDAVETERHYVGDSLVLRSVFRADRGEVAVTVALALEPGARGHELGVRSPHLLLRRVEGRAGVVEMQSDLTLRMEYGRTEPHLRTSGDGVEARGGPVRLTVSGSVPMRCEDGSVLARFAVAAGDRLEFRLQYAPAFGRAGDDGGRSAAAPTIGATIATWEDWAGQHTSYQGRFPEQVRRSSLGPSRTDLPTLRCRRGGRHDLAARAGRR